MKNFFVFFLIIFFAISFSSAFRIKREKQSEDEVISKETILSWLQNDAGDKNTEFDKIKNKLLKKIKNEKARESLGLFLDNLIVLKGLEKAIETGTDIAGIVDNIYNVVKDIIPSVKDTVDNVKKIGKLLKKLF